ncbi:Topoisomerase IV subunit A [hydrothermal vent metagenome]|uniref:DNA topoisomerase (ATP-hydrolyzing) n=1 Tax=hydrothermal vent metagenome TaxID=652676 RepID=A0A3B0RHU1_9ZZZZ
MSEKDILNQNIIEESLDDALGERYLAYALSTITQRALPDLRDGLKPVHRRILYAMRELKLRPETGFKKCARVVGDVIGRFHPHGDQAVYDALVRLAQTFAQRYPLVDGQGNFGNIDGDGAAAMRYTEARLTKAAELLLNGIDQDTVDFRQTFSGDDDEPVVLPAGFPNLLANGTSGIAVGMATSIPPHNASELIDACLHLIKYPNASISTLMKYVKGPDFPTGGVLVEDADKMVEHYTTGRGGFRLRAKWELEELSRGQWQIVVSEIPYSIQKSKLIEKLAQLIETKKLPLLGDVRDESAEDVRVVLEPKSKLVDPKLFMESLFRLSDLEVRISLNLNVLDANHRPAVRSLREALQGWLDHKQVVLQRGSNWRLRKIANRLDVLAGYLVAFLNLDEVIRIIREEDDPKASLIRSFTLNDVQAEAILNMRLRSLRKLEEMEIRTENTALLEEQTALKALLQSDEAQWAKIVTDLREVKKTLAKACQGDARRTVFASAPTTTTEEVLEALVIKEPITVVLSEKGWIRALKGKNVEISGVKFKDGDRAAFAVSADTTDKLVLFASNGKFYTIGCDKLPGGRGQGEPIRLLIDLDDSHTPIAMFLADMQRKLLVASAAGYGFVVAEKDVIALTRGGKQVLNVSGSNEASVCVPVTGDHVAVVGENRKVLIYPLEELNEMSRGKGIRLQAYKDGGLSDALVFAADEGLVWTTLSGRRTEYQDWKLWLGKRAQAGRIAQRGFPGSTRFSPPMGSV